MAEINRKNGTLEITRNPQIIRQKNIDDEEHRGGCWSSKRYFLACALFMGSFCMYALRTNISIAIIAMTQNGTSTDNQTARYEPEFNWDPKVQGLVLSMYGYGTLTSIFTAVIVKKLGGVRTYSLALLLSGTLAMLNPRIVRSSFNLFLLARFLEGVGDNWCFVSATEIWSRWSPKAERSKLMSFAFAGEYVATALNFPLCGYLSRFFGWPSTFYFTGGMAVALSSVILLSFNNDPARDKGVSRKELKLLTKNLEYSPNEKVAYFWKEILTMKPLWALIVVKIAYSCAYTFVGVCIPLYVKDMTGMRIDQVGALSGIPNIASIFTVPLAGSLADYLQNEKILNTTQVHRAYLLVGSVFGAICLFAVSLISNFTVNIIILVLFKVLLSLNYLILVLLPVYIAPRHSGSVAAIAAYGFSFGSFFTPMLIGYVVSSHEAYEWSICLSLIGVVMLVACAVFVSFGSSEVPDIFRHKPPRESKENIEELLHLK